MSSSSGWIKIHRRLLTSDVWDMGPMANRLWTYLLLNARYDPTPTTAGGITIRQGQYLRSVRKIAQDLAWIDEDDVRQTPSKDWVHRRLRKFQEMGMVELTATRVATLITVSNYKEYQAFTPPDPRAVRHPVRQPCDNTKKEKNTTTTARGAETTRNAAPQSEVNTMADVAYPDGLIEWVGRPVAEALFPKAIQAVAFWSNFGDQPSFATEKLRSQHTDEAWRLGVTSALGAIAEEGKRYDRRLFERILMDYLHGRDALRTRPRAERSTSKRGWHEVDNLPKPWELD